MIKRKKIELDLFTWDVHFASNILGPGITSHPEGMKERPSSIVKEIGRDSFPISNRPMSAMEL